MLKIAIITEYYNSNQDGSANYGGVLQAYALCEFLNKSGAESIQICYSKRKSEVKKHKFKRIKRLFQIYKTRDSLRLVLNSVKIRIRNVIGRVLGADSAIADRRKSVINFTHKIPHSKKVYTSDTISSLDNFDIYITGSDQVWHITNEASFDYVYWLMFIQNKKKISYAASMSVPEIPPCLRDKVYEALKDYTAISVREKSDKGNLDKIMQGKAVEWVLDPTFLLTREDWEHIAAENKYSAEKYIFTYILGDSKKQRKCVEKFAKEKGLKIINIPYLLNLYRSCDKKFGDIRISDVSPQLWISIIRDAEYVFTDSFHGSVFSIHYHKKFFVFKRDSDKNKSSMNSRIYSLLELFGIPERLIEDDTFPNEIDSIKDTDFENVEKILARERKISSEFLLNAINS